MHYVLKAVAAISVVAVMFGCGGTMEATSPEPLAAPETTAEEEAEVSWQAKADGLARIL